MKPLREIFEKSPVLGWPLFGSARWPGGIFYPVVFSNSVHPVKGVCLVLDADLIKNNGVGACVLEQPY